MSSAAGEFAFKPAAALACSAVAAATTLSNFFEGQITPTIATFFAFRTSGATAAKFVKSSR